MTSPEQFSLTVLIVIISVLLLVEYATVLEVFFNIAGSDVNLRSIPHNGDPALLSTVIYGHSIVPQQTTEDTMSCCTEISSNGAMAVIIMERMYLSYGLVTNAYTDSLLHGLRLAILTGAPWLIIPCGIARQKVEDVLWRLNPPAEAVFPEKVISELPSNTQTLARKIRESMLVESSLFDWMRRGHLIERMDLSAALNQPSEEFPRVMRYDENEWIVPGILWADSFEREETQKGTIAQQAAQILSRNIAQVRAKEHDSKAEETPWLQKDCFDLIIVSSMYQKFLDTLMLIKALKLSWKLQQTNGKNNSTERLVDHVRLLAASSGDTVPVWSPPDSWFVRFTSDEMFNTNASSFAQFLGIYAHTFYINYKRWFMFVKAYLIEFKVLRFFNEIGDLFIAFITETVSLQDIIGFSFCIMVNNTVNLT